MKSIVRLLLSALIITAAAQPLAAQTPAAATGWDISVYPIYAWVPLGIDINVNIPPIDGGGGSGPDFGGDIVDGRFDGAFFGGLSAQKGKFRIDADVLWAAVGGDRVETPVLTVDADLIYGHGSVGLAMRPGLFVTGGVRRLALKYDIKLGDREFERKPGVWDPLVGIAYHGPADRKMVWHAVFETGGFGVGTDVEVNTGVRFDWKPATHFGITAGYNLLYFKLTNEVAARTFTVKQTLHGPVVGIGLYF
jgi:hypothetical protein